MIETGQISWDLECLGTANSRNHGKFSKENRKILTRCNDEMVPQEIRWAGNRQR